MKEDQALTDWGELSELGWLEMRKKLAQHHKIEDSVFENTTTKRINRFSVVFTLLLLLLLNAPPGYLHDSLVVNSSKHSLYASGLTTAVTSVSSERKNKTGHKSEHTKINKENAADTLRINSPFPVSESVLYPQRSVIPAQLFAGMVNAPVNMQLPVTDNINKLQKNIPIAASDKKRFQFLKKIQVFGGAGANLTTSSAGTFSLSDINIHPALTVSIPLGKKISLHTGLRAISTLHQRGVNVKKEEWVNSTTANPVDYNINTTSIIKVSYFDVPLALHYSINRQWSIGAGVQLSRLYKIKIGEEKKGYDQNNTIVSATAQQFTVNASQMAAAFQEEVNVKRLESRLMAEITFHPSRWMFSAGYYYGIGKNIELKEAPGQYHQYRNEYLKVGIEYRLTKN